MPPSTTPHQPPTEPVPSAWPGAFGIYAYTKAAVRYNLGTLLGLFGLTLVVSIAANLASSGPSVANDDGSLQTSATGLIIEVITQLVGIWLSAATAYTLIAGVKRQKIILDDSLRDSAKIFLPYLGVNLLVGLIAIASIVFFVIPAFFIIPRLVLAQYYLVEGKLGITESIAASWNATKGNVGKVWGIFGFNALLLLAAITIIGIPFAIYFGFMYQAAVPLLYFFLKMVRPLASTPVAQDGPTAPTPPPAN